MDRILRAKPVTRVSSACLLPRGSIIFPDISSFRNFLLPPLYLLNPFHPSRSPAIPGHRICWAFWILYTFYQCHDVFILFELILFLICFFEGRNHIFYFFGFLSATSARQSPIFQYKKHWIKWPLQLELREFWKAVIWIVVWGLRKVANTRQKENNGRTCNISKYHSTSRIFPLICFQKTPVKIMHTHKHFCTYIHVHINTFTYTYIYIYISTRTYEVNSQQGILLG